MGARLEWALLNYFIDTHLADGYEMILPPHMLEYECGLTAGQFPKFADEVYKIENPTDGRVHYMLPTAEAARASLYRNEILTEADLPKKLFAYTPCPPGRLAPTVPTSAAWCAATSSTRWRCSSTRCRRRATSPLTSLWQRQRTWVKGLGFHFRTVKLAAEDCSASMARTYDIEINIPSMHGYKEVSSVSNARDYQARRGMIRVKRANGKVEYVHTLNGSGLATSRILPALVEQNQNADGSVNVPDVLRRYVGTDVIRKA